jgi:hypothetical protein
LGRILIKHNGDMKVLHVTNKKVLSTPRQSGNGVTEPNDNPRGLWLKWGMIAVHFNVVFTGNFGAKQK